MVLSKIYTNITDGIRNYFRETSVHGFRYVVDGHGSFFRILWMLVVVVTFMLCGYLVKETLVEMERNPIVTIIEEVDISKIPAPAISVLVHQGDAIEESLWYKKMFNKFDVCNPKIDMNKHELLAPFLAINSKFNKLIRKQFAGTNLYQSDSIKELRENEKVAFCAFSNKMMSFGNNDTIRQIYTKQVGNLVDSDFLANDFKEIIKRSLGSEAEYDPICEGHKNNISEEDTLHEWNSLVLPINYKLYNNYGCSER